LSKVLIVSHDYVRRAMAGPAIRSLELARQVERAGHLVTLAAPISTDLEPEAFEIRAYDPQQPATLRGLAAGADVIVLQGWVLEHNSFLASSGSALVVDLYDPFPLEYLASVAMDPTPGKFPAWDDVLGTMVEQLRLGDFFMCASERQRDMWTGALTTLGRVNSATYEADPSLRRLIDVVPFGIPAEPPQRRGPGIRGVVEGVEAGDFVLLWGGGVYNWFDPLSLIRAVGRVVPGRPRVKLVFLSASHPNPDVPEMRMLVDAMALSRELGLEGQHVFFNRSWIPYDRRADWLLDADLGVSTHLDHLETRFSFRTRILDYFWAGLPILCTEGDTLAELVATMDLGRAVPAEDVDALAAAIDELASEPADGAAARRARVRESASAMTWEQAAAPLVEFAGAPRRARDLAALELGAALPVPLRGDTERRRRARLPGPAERVGRLAKRTVQVTASEGPAGLARAIRRKLSGRAKPV
jgi:glycosyltransferase involved in cell wall biosynthesis